MEHVITLPVKIESLRDLRAGNAVRLSGTLYTARDAAHARLIDMLAAGEALPIPRGCAIYYAGPCPAAPGEIIGPCGPTTSKRMDPFTPALADYGVTVFLGKGARTRLVNDVLRGRAVYLAATGGAGMLLASHVTSCELVAFADLGPEAIYRLTVFGFPAIVALDLAGNDCYERATRDFAAPSA